MNETLQCSRCGLVLYGAAEIGGIEPPEDKMWHGWSVRVDDRFNSISGDKKSVLWLYGNKHSEQLCERCCEVEGIKWLDHHYKYLE